MNAYTANTNTSTEPQTTEPKIGDVVELKSGGPAMTISRLLADASYQPSYIHSVACLWFDKDNKLQIGDFDPETLRLVAR